MVSGTKPKPSGSKSRQDDDESQDEDQMDEYDYGEGVTVIDGIRIPPPIDVTPAPSTGSRLMILRVENSYFKSYPASAIVGPFHKCFNAIVGPNGNGKSNIIDSLLFVFGYRATKIRSKKLSVLIHKSALHPNVQSCTVAVHFAEIIDEEGDNYRIIPNSEFVVSRTACKDSSSYYQLNDRKVHFREISAVLKKHGVDLDHNRFLILQGEVEQIAMMKPKAENENECGLLEYLEDIIGTHQYKKPLSLLHEKVELYSDARSEKLNRVKLVENEMNEMKEPMEEAVKFLKTENTIVIKKNLICQGQIYELTKQLDGVLEGKRKIEDTHKEFMEKFELIKSEQQEKNDILKQEQARFDQLNTRKESLKEAFSNAEKKRVHLTETMSQLNKSRIKNKEQILEEKRKIEKLESKTEHHTKLIQEMEANVEEFTASHEKYTEEKTKLLESFKTETKGLQEKKEEIQNDLVVLKKAVDETKTAFTLAESELKIYTSTEENEKTKLEDLRNTLQTVISSIDENKKQVDQLKKKIPATEKSLQSATEDLRKEKYEEHQIVQEIRDKRAQFEERKSSMQASQSRGKVLDSLTQQKREGNCPGLYGRLGDLGAIDKKYDVAISTACGPLDNIVVDTVDTAEWCIEFLKKYDLGRATFIALDKQEHLRQLANSKIKTPENVPRLYDLIKIQDEDVRTAFYYALRDTLVADNIDQATRIAYGAQRFRVVTLNGDLIETSGTMSGGGKSVSRGRMGQSVRVSNVNPKELDNLERTLAEMEQQVRESQRKQHSLDSQINTLQPELRQMKFDLEKFSMELKALQQQRPELEVQLKEQESRCKSVKANPQQVKKLQDVVERKRAAYQEASETADALQREVDKITKEIKDKTSSKLKLVDKNINETARKISMCKDDITKMNVAIKTAERDCKKSNQKINTMEQEIKDMESQLREFMEQSNEIEDDAKKLLTCLEEITEQLTEVEKSYKDIKNIASKLKEKEDKLKLKKVDIENELKTVTAEENKIKATMHQLEVKISRLQLSEYEGNTEHELKKYTQEEIENTDFAEVERELQNAENYIKVAKPNLNIIQQYNKVREVYMERFKELEEVINKRAYVKEHLDKLRTRRKEEFLKGYCLIKMKVKEMYQTLTLDGDADFDLGDTYDPFAEGIHFNVRPPKKSWKKISNLSGGEKTLSSLALVFALHHYKPSPFYFMDEIDAALDFKNVSLVGNYIKDRTKNAQFIIISLRPNMYELADYLVGIYKVEDCTNCITFDPRQYEMVSENDQVVPMVSGELPPMSP